MSTISAGTTSTNALVNTGDTTGNLVFQTNGTTTAMTIDTSQNVGVGVTPSAWSSFTGLQVGPSGSVSNSGTGTPVSAFSNNAYYNGTSWVYINTAAAAQYQLSTSQHIWRYAASGSGNITWSEAMRLDSSGNLGIGTSSPAQKLDVNGSVKSAGYFIGSTGTTGFAALGTTGAATDGGNFVGRSATSTYNQAGAEIYTGGSERMRIDSSGNLMVGATSTTWNGTIVKSAGTISLASGASINLSSSLCGGAIVSIYVTGSGNGGLFYLNYSATSVKLAGDGDTTDTGSNFAVYKNASSHVSTLKNKAGSTQTFSVVVVAGQLT